MATVLGAVVTVYSASPRAPFLSRGISMLIHGSELVAVAQELVKYWDSRWNCSENLKNPSTLRHAE